MLVKAGASSARKLAGDVPAADAAAAAPAQEQANVYMVVGFEVLPCSIERKPGADIELVACGKGNDKHRWAGAGAGAGACAALLLGVGCSQPVAGAAAAPLPSLPAHPRVKASSQLLTRSAWLCPARLVRAGPRR
jgi:hypothetical protein